MDAGKGLSKLWSWSWNFTVLWEVNPSPTRGLCQDRWVKPNYFAWSPCVHRIINWNFQSRVFRLRTFLWPLYFVFCLLHSLFYHFRKEKKGEMKLLTPSGKGSLYFFIGVQIILVVRMSQSWPREFATPCYEFVHSVKGSPFLLVHTRTQHASCSM
jgi:hypothetical protein